MIEFFAPGIPRPKGSKDQFGRESSRYLRSWMDSIILVARGASRGYCLDPPYRIEVEYVMPRPKRPTHPWPSTCDIDKLDRAVLDALVQGGVILDDRHVVAVTASKRFAEDGEKAGAHLVVSTA